MIRNFREVQSIETANPKQTEPHLSDIRDQFKDACTTLWESEVRGTLIFKKDLMLCQGCLGLFYKQDNNSNHPKDQSQSVLKMCSDNIITCPEAFDKVMWQQASYLAVKIGKIVVPSLNPQHVEYSAKTTVANQSEEKLHYLQVRAVELAQQVEKLTADNNRLICKNKKLEGDNERLIREVLAERRVVDNIRVRAMVEMTNLTFLLNGPPDEDSIYEPKTQTK